MRASVSKSLTSSAARKKLSDAVASDTAVEVQGAINSLTTLQGRRMLDAYQTAADMKAVLTPEQRASLQAMTPAQLRSAMMSHMTMDQMSQMMQIMRGAAGAATIGGGMMGQGMMNECPLAAPQQPGA
jgi:sulfite reductase alpha subunit-like flavoprotein